MLCYTVTRSLVGSSRHSATAALICTLHASGRRYYSQNAESPRTIGFIGLGQMGYPMASHLLAKTEGRFLIHDVVPATLLRFRAEQSEANRHRIEQPGSPRAIADQADVVITMLPESHHVREVYCGQGGILEGLKAGAVCIDSSTIAPKVSQEVAEAAHQQGVVAVDAPVSGGVVGAKAGTLTFMVGARSADDFARVQPYLTHMGKNFVHCGKPGAGQIAKICNNMLLGISMIGTAEAMRLGIKLGVDPTVLAGVLNTSTGRCWPSEVNNPHPGIVPTAPSSRDYEGGFGVALIAKDMNLAVEAAAQVKSTVMLGAAAQQIYGQVARTPDLKQKDFSVVYKWISAGDTTNKNGDGGSS